MLAAAAEPIKAAAPIATPPHLSIISSAVCKFKNDAVCVVLFDLRLFFSQHISQWQKGARFSHLDIAHTGISACKKSSASKLSELSPEPSEFPNRI
jgi:hypothetical protein